MRSRAMLLCGLMTGLLTLPALGADTITHEASGLTFLQPDGWEGEESEEVEGLYQMTAPEGAVVIQCWVIEAEDLDAALEGLGEGLAEHFEDVQLSDEVVEAEINGLPRVILSGTAAVEGDPIHLAIVVIGTEKPAIFLALGTAEDLEAYSETLKEISGSIKLAEME